MSSSIFDFMNSLKGLQEDKLVALLRAIEAVKAEKAACGCGKSPCVCPPCAACGKRPCACKKVGCGCGKSPCGCKPVGCGCGKTPCACNPCRPNAGDYLLELGRLNLCFYESLFALNKKYNHSLAEALCIRIPDPCAPPCVDPCADPCAHDTQQTLFLRAYEGEQAEGLFTLANSSGTDREVRFLLGEFRANDADALPFVPPLSLDLLDAKGDSVPDRVLARGEEGTVRVVVPLKPPFVAGQIWRGVVQVESSGTLRLHLSIEVLGKAPKGASPKAGA